MKRVVPHDVTQLRNYLLMKKEFEDANFVSMVIGRMESGQKLNFTDAMRFTTLVSRYKKVLNLQSIFGKTSF